MAAQILTSHSIVISPTFVELLLKLATGAGDVKDPQLLQESLLLQKDGQVP